MALYCGCMRVKRRVLLEPADTERLRSWMERMLLMYVSITRATPEMSRQALLWWSKVLVVALDTLGPRHKKEGSSVEEKE